MQGMAAQQAAGSGERGANPVVRGEGGHLIGADSFVHGEVQHVEVPVRGTFRAQPRRFANGLCSYGLK